MRFLADEDFDNRIVRGLLRRLPHLDLIRVQDSPVKEQSDEAVLAWAAVEDRILLSHDVNTMIEHASHRLRSGLPLAGLFLISQSLPVRMASDELVLIAQFGLEGEYRNQIRFIPFD